MHSAASYYQMVSQTFIRVGLLVYSKVLYIQKASHCSKMVFISLPLLERIKSPNRGRDIKISLNHSAKHSGCIVQRAILMDFFTQCNVVIFLSG